MRSAPSAPRADAVSAAGCQPPHAVVPVRSPNVHPGCLNVPRIGEDGIEEVCHLVTDEDPDTALCGTDVSGFPWNPPWPRCEACLAVARGEMN